MIHEHPTQPDQPTPAEAFGLTQQEQLSYRVSDEHFREILDDGDTTVHTIREDENNYGEFLFVTASRPTPDGRALLTFYGLGFHDLREEWFTDEWFWYSPNPSAEVLRQRATEMEVEEMLRERRRDIAPYIADEEPSDRARLFAMLADLTDEDAACTELEDLEEMGGLFDEDML